MNTRPTLLYADAKGNIVDWPELEMVGRSGTMMRRLHRGDWIPLPTGSELFLLPMRLPVGYRIENRRFETLVSDPYDASKSVQAVAAFVAPAHTQIYSAAYATVRGAPLLPLFAYTAVGWHEGKFVAAAFRVDSDQRQDLRHFDPDKIRRNARRRMSQEPGNRLIQHLGKCAITYGCPAARNLFMKRWEAPLPSSPACNARCLGCISLQENTGLCATQDRITFVPTADEIAGVAIPHLKEASKAVVSFGQGCEGEPLLQARTLEEAIRVIRSATSRGTVNLNTNGSLSDEVEKLCTAGLNSIRVSINSCRPQYYDAYFRPRSYSFGAVRRSIQAAKAQGKFVSINYFVLPGFTDEVAEFDALCSLVDQTHLDLIQMRNMNIDPEWYLREMGHSPGKTMGIRRLISRLTDRFPELRLGYFNPCLDPSSFKKAPHER